MIRLLFENQIYCLKTLFPFIQQSNMDEIK
jgi:hypothetical protein